MEFIFPKRTTFETPEGDYRAVIRDAFVSPKEQFRIVFEIRSLQSQSTIYLAGKNYKQGDAHLAEDLIELMGERAVAALIRPDGTIVGEKLKGQEVDIRIEHIENDEYEKPYAYVSRIKPPGTLVRE